MIFVLFFEVNLYCNEPSPLALLLLNPIGFRLSCFHLHLVHANFLFPFWFFSTICLLFRNVLFSLQMFVFLIVFFFLFLISNLNALWSEKILGMIPIFFFFFFFTKARFMAQDVIYPGEGSMCTWEKGEIHCFGVKCPIDIN